MNEEIYLMTGCKHPIYIGLLHHVMIFELCQGSARLKLLVLIIEIDNWNSKTGKETTEHQEASIEDKLDVLVLPKARRVAPYPKKA